MNPNEKPRTFISDPQKLAEDMGEGRISVSEKAQYLEEHDARFFRNVDFVNVETYRSVLKPILRDGDVVLNVGAGYAIAPTDTVLDSVTAAIQLIDKKVTVVPVDYNHDRTKSWLLLDVEDKEKSDNLELEPVTGSATELPIGTSTVDGYYSVNLINEPRSEGSEKEFVRAAATEAYRVLKPGGFVLISSFGYVW